MELTGSDENQVKAGPDRDKEKKRTRWVSSMDAVTSRLYKAGPTYI